MARGQNNPLVDELIRGGKHTSSQIAQRTGYHKCSVNNRAKHLGVTLPRPPGYLLNHDFFKSRSPEMAYVLGFIAADGCVNYNAKTRVHRLSIRLHGQDREVLENIRLHLDTDKPIGLSGPHIQLQLTSKTMFDDLVALGVTERKSLTLSWIDLGPELTPHLVRGYFDGDGTITLNKYNYPTVCLTGTREFLSGVREASPVRDGRLRQHTNKNTWTLSYHCHRAMGFCDWMYAGSTPATRLKRKYDRYVLKQSLQKAVA